MYVGQFWIHSDRNIARIFSPNGSNVSNYKNHYYCTSVVCRIVAKHHSSAVAAVAAAFTAALDSTVGFHPEAVFIQERMTSYI